ncbi:hypothetical protein CDAR_385881 [Caerostris darwini]|uniref:Uncharacterized protein n=1 Tax=Caerostris darwini TaxID=1538125 RepID=A0AAV4QFL4_9ARAC|nr:hypothetical protein CDAR_385881 [Caerostris darwini]
MDFFVHVKENGVIRHSERFYGSPVRTSGEMCVPSDILRNSMVFLWGIHGKFDNILKTRQHPTCREIRWAPPCGNSVKLGSDKKEPTAIDSKHLISLVAQVTIDGKCDSISTKMALEAIIV